MKIKHQFCSKCHNRAIVLYSMVTSVMLGVYYKGPPVCKRCLNEIRERAYAERDADKCDKENDHA